MFFFGSESDFLTQSASLAVPNVQMVQAIAPLVNQVSPRMRTIIPNVILLNRIPPQVKLVLLVASATGPLARRALRHASHAQEQHQATASSVLLVSLLSMVDVYRPTRMASVKGQVLSPTTINGNVIVSQSKFMTNS